MVDSLRKIFERELDKLSDEVKSFHEDSDIWITPGAIKNSPGNLCLHVCGNLQHFIGGILGNSGYERQREKEFSSKNIPKEILLKEIDKTKDIVDKTLQNLDSEKLHQNYPINVFNEDMTIAFFLIHLSTHLSYHIGQINYLRRILLN